MELKKRVIWMVMRWELDEDDVEICKCINAFSTKGEALERCAKYKKQDDGLKYMTRRTYSWFPE